jgi:RNA polymerase sigma-70 factor (ECF subfamily)
MLVMKAALDRKKEAELLQRYVAGDQEAFRELLNRYKNSLYIFLRHFLGRQELVEDVFQETFLQLFTSHESFDPSRPFKPWLFTIAANKAKDALRQYRRSFAVSIGGMTGSEDASFGEVLNSITSYQTTPYDNIEQSERAMRVRQTIADMPADLREILILSYFNRFSYKQMADILSIPIGTVKSRLHTAVNRFAKEWKARSRID